MNIAWSDFEKLEIRAGTIINATVFANARKPAYKLEVDFGEFGIKKSAAQITDIYNTEALVGKQVVAVLNFPPKQIANFFSECLILGVYNATNQVVLLQPERPVDNGMKIG